MGRRWGQHFLRSQSIIDQIVMAADLTPEDRVIEIGPGEGVVTTGLCQKSRNVHVFEIDPELCTQLRLSAPDNLSIHEGDFLRQDLRPLDDQGPKWKVVANLPYYITAPILERLFWQRPLPLHSAILMMQDEVAQRLCGAATREAGALTYIVGAFHQVDYLFGVPPHSFDPPPNVNSAVVRVTPSGRPNTDLADTKRYERLLNAAFNQRRKQLGRSLRALHPEAPDLLKVAGIEPSRRPETLTVEEFWTLARNWPNSV